MAASLSSLSSTTPSTTTSLLYHSSSHFKCKCKNSKIQATYISIHKTLHYKSKQRHSLVVLNSAASGVQECNLSSQNVRFRLDNLGPQPGSRKKAKRKGRWHSAGQGGSCGFGMKGQKSRSGPSVRKGFEGGQMPLYRRIPKLKGIAGGMHAGLPKYVPVNLKYIADAGFKEGEEVSLESLKMKDLINPSGRDRDFL
ncbi:UNVERIFIED_CONTAM: 50S ribosomal protein L15, chloroplastic [Sesamum latifolium]|uniref:50S ribosomal protein L15, chloroplastic n=1 Tax=Sesamum latifolium TaxID=2727402 RepID=A0AAW2YCV8_9LAMI